MIEQEIDRVFGELGQLPNIPVEANDISHPCDVYAVMVNRIDRPYGDVEISGWVKVHHLGTGCPMMTPVVGWAFDNASLADLKLYLCDNELPQEWYKEVRR